MAKQNKFSAWIWVLGILTLVAIWGVSTYNGLITSEGAVDSAWAQVETQYQRRADLVPQLVATTQGAADFEQSTLTEVTEARTQWQDTANDPNATLGQQIAASNSFDSALSRLLVTVEAYPTLTATENFQTLQSQLEGTENRISVARMDFNDAAKNYNVKVRRVPTNIIASIFGFETKPFFESSEGAENAPTIEFNFDE